MQLLGAWLRHAALRCSARTSLFLGASPPPRRLRRRAPTRASRVASAAANASLPTGRGPSLRRAALALEVVVLLASFATRVEGAPSLWQRAKNPGEARLLDAIFVSVMDRGKIEVIAGVNLPMLIKLASLRQNEKLERAVLGAQEAGRKYINVASQLLADARR